MRLFVLVCTLVIVSGCRYGFDFAGADGDPAAGDPLDDDAGTTADALSPGSDAPGGGPDAGPRPFCDPTNPDLVGCYQFENSAADGSSAGNDLTTNDGSFVTGQRGMALYTANGGALAPEDSSMQVPQLTLEVWVRPDSTPVPTGPRMGIIDKDNEYSIFLYENDEIRCGGGTLTPAFYPLPLGEWTHLACTNDGSSLSIFIDGELVNSLPATPPDTDGTEGWGVGMNSPSGDLFDGAIDDLRIWRIARSPADICAAAAPACP